MRDGDCMAQNENAVDWAVGTGADGNGIILHTTNGGTTWKKQEPKVSKFFPEGVSAVDENHAWIVGDAGLILRTTDGEHWEKQNAPEGYSVCFSKVSAFNAITAWLVGYDGVILCTKDGKHWIPQKSPAIPDVQLQGVHAVDATTVWATGFPNQCYATILRTTNGGKTWERLGQAIQYCGDGGLPYVKIIGVSALDSDTAWVVGHCTTILHTKDGGNTWKDQTPVHLPDYDANEITVFIDEKTGNPTGWAAEDNNAVCHTTDGEDWEKHSTPGGGYLLDVSAIDEKTAWVVGSTGPEGVILHTANGGQDWEKQYYKENGEIVKVRSLKGISLVIPKGEK